MPKVGKTDFPYTKAGIAKAKAWAEMTGQKMQMGKKYQAGGQAHRDKLVASERERLKTAPTLQGAGYMGTDEEMAQLAMGVVGGGGLGRAIFKTAKKAPSLISQANHLRKLLLKAITKTEKKAIQKKLSPIEKQITKREMEAGRKAVERGQEKPRRITQKSSEEHWDRPQYITRDRRMTSKKSLRQQGGPIATPSQTAWNAMVKYQDGGEVPEGRRLFGTNPKKKKKVMMQTADIGPVRGETYQEGGEVVSRKGTKKLAPTDIDFKSPEYASYFKQGEIRDLDKYEKERDDYTKKIVLSSLVGNPIGIAAGLAGPAGPSAIQSLFGIMPKVAYKKGGKVKMPKGWHV